MVEAAAMHKDWLTLKEAAFYCGLSDRQFKGHYRDWGVTVRKFEGKLLFSRQELNNLIRCQPSTSGESAGTSTGVKADTVTASPSAMSPSTKRKRRSRRKNSNSPRASAS